MFAKSLNIKNLLTFYLRNLDIIVILAGIFQIISQLEHGEHLIDGICLQRARCEGTSSPIFARWEDKFCIIKHLKIMDYYIKWCIVEF